MAQGGARSGRLRAAMLGGALAALVACSPGALAPGAAASGALAPWPTVTPRPSAPAPSPRPVQTPSPTALPTPTTRATAVGPWAAADAAPGRLAIPAIGLDAPVVPIAWDARAQGGAGAWEDPATRAGWLETSALPGHGSNTVIIGHHNIRGEVFRRLVDVQVGDLIALDAGDARYTYRVRERFIIPEKDASAAQRAQNALWIAPTYDERLTLLTCWPYRDNTHRLVVIASPAPGVDPWAEDSP